MPPKKCTVPRRSRAFSLLEAIILMTIVAIVSVGAAVGLQASVRVPSAVDNLLAVDSAVADAMERKIVDARSDFPNLAGYIDSVTINGTSYTRTVTITALNAPDGSGACTDYKQITVQIGNQSATTYVTKIP